MAKIKTIGILTSGGDAADSNNSVTTIVIIFFIYVKCILFNIKR